MTTTIDRFHTELDQLTKDISLVATIRQLEAEDELEFMCEDMAVEADYRWAMALMLTEMPLGIQSWVELRLVEKWAAIARMGHIADQLIAELSAIGARNALNRPKRALA